MLIYDDILIENSGHSIFDPFGTNYNSFMDKLV